MTAPEPRPSLRTPEELEALRREDRIAARLRRRVLYGVVIFWLFVIQLVFPPAPRLVWNASASAPVGLYWVRPGASIAKGDIVVARTPGAVRRLAAVRHYVPENVPLVKRVAASRGDRVCAIGMSVLVNGRRVADRLRQDGQGRPLPWWNGCRALRAGEYLLLMADVPDSFDGRYFGITGEADLIGNRVRIVGCLDGRWFIAMMIVDGDGNAHGMSRRRDFRNRAHAMRGFSDA